MAVVSIPVVDGHNDLAWQLYQRSAHLDLRGDLSDSGLHTDLPRLRRGGVAAQFWSVYVPCGPDEAQSVVAVLTQIDLMLRLIARHPADLVLATTTADVKHAMATGRIASLLGAEGGHCIGSSLAVLRMLYELGVRYLTLTHSKNTPWADSATDEPGVGGLSGFGFDVVREMNRLGMLVDLSHVATPTMHAALNITRAPAFFSHSSARALCDHPRNVPDVVLERVRESGGVVMVTFVPPFLSDRYRLWSRARDACESDLREIGDSAERTYRRDRWLTANPCPPCGVSDVADHIEHIRQVAGIDAIGLGGDFDGTPFVPDGLVDVGGYPALFAELAKRGWSTEECVQVGWRNVFRVMRDTENIAERNCGLSQLHSRGVHAPGPERSG
ncbi:dipeptidase [Nocardia brasiliensis]